jgi:hypothetical protein
VLREHAKQIRNNPDSYGGRMPPGQLIQQGLGGVFNHLLAKAPENHRAPVAPADFLILRRIRFSPYFSKRYAL